MQPQSLPESSQRMMEMYGSRENLLKVFNPDAQMKLCHDADDCIFGDYPTLANLTAFGKGTPIAWLIPQLYDLSEYCGCRDKLQGRPLEECASVIAAEFFYLKISELMLFFHRFKSGRYGRFYGSVDPLLITTSLRTFLSERGNAYFEHENRERMAEAREGRKNAVTWEEYCMEKYGEVKPHPFTRIK